MMIRHEHHFSSLAKATGLAEQKPLATDDPEQDTERQVATCAKHWCVNVYVLVA